MDKKERIRILTNLLDENYYFKPQDNGDVENKYEICDNGTRMEIYSNFSWDTIHGISSFISTLIGLNFNFYFEYSITKKRVQIAVY